MRRVRKGDMSEPILKEGWTMPEPPDIELEEGERLAAVATNIGDWALEWYVVHVDGSATYAAEYDRVKYEHGCLIPWPFGDNDLATGKDLEALGFVEW